MELKFKSGQMANFWTDTELQARGAEESFVNGD